MAIKSKNFNVDKDGNMTCNNAKVTGGKIQLEGNGNFVITGDNNSATYIDGDGMLLGKQDNYIDITYGAYGNDIQLFDSSGSTWISPSGISTPSVTQTSLKENKKNFEKLKNGLDIIRSTEIYKYNLKSQNDGDKKHIGFVIGKDYKHSKEITALDKENKEVGVDLYSMVSVAYKAIQEQQEVIEKLQEKIQELEAKQ